MKNEEFNIDRFRKVLSDLFEVEESALAEDYDLSSLIKDSIDLGELVAVLRSQYGVEPLDWNIFKTHNQLRDVFNNFKKKDHAL